LAKKNRELTVFVSDVDGSNEKAGRRQPSLPREQLATYIRVNVAAYSVASHLGDAWKRPVRHNQQIERAALWYALDVGNDCERLLDPTDEGTYLRPSNGDATARYDAEAAIRMIPPVLPFTDQERRVLSTNQDRRNNFQFEYGIGDAALGQLALVERWHEWLWMPPDDPSDRRASPGTDAELLALACTRLANALSAVVAQSL
jgi:hypothetical protein